MCLRLVHAYYRHGVLFRKSIFVLCFSYARIGAGAIETEYIVWTIEQLCCTPFRWMESKWYYSNCAWYYWATIHIHAYIFWNFSIQLCMLLCLLQNHLYISEMLIFEYGHHSILSIPADLDWIIWWQIPKSAASSCTWLHHVYGVCCNTIPIYCYLIIVLLLCNVYRLSLTCTY